jgi:hypothetical protein
LQGFSAVCSKPGNAYALVSATEDVLVKNEQKDSAIGLKDNKKD